MAHGPDGAESAADSADPLEDLAGGRTTVIMMLYGEQGVGKVRSWTASALHVPDVRS